MKNFFLLLIFGGILAAQDVVDDESLFSQPDEVQVTTGPAEELSPDSFLVPSGIHLTGETWAELGYFTGLSRFPVERARWMETVSHTGVLLLKSKLVADARPTPDLRAYTSLQLEVPDATEFLPSYFSIDEWFVDYTLGKTLFVRGGKQTITWGVGRIFTPGDFLSEVEGGVSLKLFLPLGTNGLTGVIHGRKTYFKNPESPSPRELAYAILGETTLDSWTLGAKGYYREEDGWKGGVTIRTTQGTVDFFGEVFLLAPRFQWAETDVQALGGFFWEGGTPKLQLQGEYWFDGRVPDQKGSYAGLAASLKNLPLGGWAPKGKWEHFFADRSGEILFGIEGPLAPALTNAWGLAWTYGPEDSLYRVQNEDPDKRSLVLGTKITLNFKY